jgi:hypothetical protein
MIRSRTKWRTARKPFRDAVMIGNVIIPQDVNRDDYVRYALRTNTACVITANGDFIVDVPIAYSYCGVNDGFINTMEFPKEKLVLGSQVLMITIEKSSLPIIIGCLPRRQNNFSANSEEQFILSRISNVNIQGSSIGQKNVTIEGRGLEAILNLIATSSESKGGEVNINAENRGKSGKIYFKTNYFNVVVSENIDIVCQRVTNIRSDESLNVQSPLINLGKEDLQSMVLGDTAVELLKELTQLLFEARVTTAIGTMPLLNFASYKTLQDKLDTMLSEKNKTQNYAVK